MMLDCGSHAFQIVHRLMVNITQPALLCFGKVPDDPAFRHHFLQLMSYLQAYKEVCSYIKINTISYIVLKRGVVSYTLHI